MMYENAAARSHPENGMTDADMNATLRVAQRRGEIIMFRSTGPWARRWIERGYPTKGFHVKGKSSNWGPQAGLIPWDGIYSKVGHSAQDVAKGNKLNKEGIDGKFAVKVPLTLTLAQLHQQRDQDEESPPRRAIASMTETNGRNDAYLYAVRPGDRKRFAFLASIRLDGKFDILAFPEEHGGLSPDRLTMRVNQATPLYVMATTEVNPPAPMTGDYDLFTVCPSWGSFGNMGFYKPLFGNAEPKYGPLDSPLDPTLDGMSYGSRTGYSARMQGYERKLATLTPGSKAHESLKKGIDTLKSLPGWANKIGPDGKVSKTGLEDADMGNVTGRIMQVVTALNAEMNAAGPNFHRRRVHHNAEAGRPFAPGMGDGLPVTTFHPGHVGPYTFQIGAFDDEASLRAYIDVVRSSGYVVPRNLSWLTR